MNAELKSMLQAVFALAKMVVDIVEKKGTSAIIQDVEQVAFQVPAIIANISDIQAEVSALTDPAHIADLLAFVSSQFAGIDSDAKAKAILDASIKLAADMASDGYGLYKAIKG